MTEIRREKTPTSVLGTIYERKVLQEHMGKRQDRATDLKAVSLFSLLPSEIYS